MSFNAKKAMILAAGFGTRLKPLTDTLPKPLAPVGGIPLIFYNLALLKKFGINDVVINIHHLGEKIIKTLGTGKELGFTFHYSKEKEILGTGGGIKEAEKFLNTDSFFILNGDILTDINLDNLATFHQQGHFETTLALKEAAKNDDFSLIEVKENQIVGFPEKPQKTSNTPFFFTGVHLMNRSVLKNIPEHQKTCIVRDTYVPRLKTGLKIGAFISEGYWNDLGTIERLNETSQLLTNKKISLSYEKEINELKTSLLNSPLSKDWIPL